MEMETEINVRKTPETKKIPFERSTPVIIIFLGFILLKAVPLLWNNVEISDLKEHCLYFITIHYPILAGMLLSFITWNVMYFDSAVPGIDPPTPFSPYKYREASHTDIHLNYMFALTIGPLVTILLYSGV